MAKKQAAGKQTFPDSREIERFSGIIKLLSDPRCFYTALSLSVLAALLYYPLHSGDYDLWWHLRYGAHFIANNTWLVDHAAYTWTPADNSWMYVTWIGSSLLYLIYSLAGLAGLHVLLFAVLGAVALLFAFFLRSTGVKASLLHVALLFACAVAVNPTVIYIKPELFTVVFFALAVLLYFLSKSHNKSYFAFYPPLFLVWVNTHGAFLIGLLFVCLALGFELVQAVFARSSAMDAKLIRRFAVFTALSLVVTVLNPYGWRYPVETVARLVGGDKSYQNLILAYINRWDYLFPDMYVFRRTNAAWALVLMEGALLYVMAESWFKRRFFDIAVFAVNLAFFAFAMKMARAVIYFPLTALFSIPYVYFKSGGLKEQAKTAPAAACLIVGIIGVLTWNTIAMNTETSWFGTHAETLYPVRETEFVREHALPGPLFNDYLSGGYLVWALYPDYKVFIDPRQRPFEKTGVWQDFITLRQHPDTGSLRQFHSKYPFRTALIHHGKYPDLVAMFMASPDWRLVYFDTVAAVFMTPHDADAAGLALTPDILNTGRFANIHNPAVLLNLFNVYTMIDKADAQKILEQYRTNVRGLYSGKDRQLGMMSGMIARMQ